MYRKAKPKEQVLSWLMLSASNISVHVWRGPEQLSAGTLTQTTGSMYQSGRCRPGMCGYSMKRLINQDTEELSSHPAILGLGQEELAIEPGSDW